MELVFMISFSRLSQRFCRIIFALLTSFSVVTASIKSEAYQLEFYPIDTNNIEKKVKDNLKPYQSKLKISANNISFKDIFQEFGVEGSIIIYDTK